jgi:hypothetical protein
MADSIGIFAQGTIIKRNGTAIAELKDITPPSLTRNPLETTMHNSQDDSYVVGIRRRGELQFTVNFLPQDEATHAASAGLIKAWVDGSKDLYEIDFTDGAIWYFSGFVTAVSPSAPVDGVLEAQISIRPTNGMILT